MFFLASVSVRPPLGDPAAVKKHAFAPKRFRKRGYILRTPTASVSGPQPKRLAVRKIKGINEAARSAERAALTTDKFNNSDLSLIPKSYL